MSTDSRSWRPATHLRLAAALSPSQDIQQVKVVHDLSWKLRLRCSDAGLVLLVAQVAGKERREPLRTRCLPVIQDLYE